MSISGLAAGLGNTGQRGRVMCSGSSGRKTRIVLGTMHCMTPRRCCIRPDCGCPRPCLISCCAAQRGRSGSGLSLLLDFSVAVLTMHFMRGCNACFYRHGVHTRTLTEFAPPYWNRSNDPVRRVPRFTIETPIARRWPRNQTRDPGAERPPAVGSARALPQSSDGTRRIRKATETGDLVGRRAAAMRSGSFRLRRCSPAGSAAPPG